MALRKISKVRKSKPRKKLKAHRTKRSLLRRAVGFGLVVGLWGTLLTAIGLLGVFFTLPDPSEAIALDRRLPVVTLLDRHQRPFYRLRGHAAEPARISELPALLPKAFLAMEDRRFYQHYGIDPLGILRALWINLRAGGVRQGGSTITQQVAKNLFLSPKRTLLRKLQEAMLALWLEQKFDKTQILEIYLNRIYLGSGVYGINAAAQQYFGKPAMALSLAEIALLAGLPKAPSRTNPLNNPQAAAERARIVLNVLETENVIVPKEARHARAILNNPALLPLRRIRGAAFHRWIVRHLSTLDMDAEGDLTIFTTLDADLQRTLENQIDALRSTFAAKHISQAAVVSLDHSGAVRAMIGGVRWQPSDFNRAVQARRQTGSVFKIIVYSAALEAGYTPETRVSLERLPNADGWWPEDTTPDSITSLSLREGMARSSNRLAVRLGEKIGRDKIIAMARRMGITAPIPDLPSIVLGVAGVSLLEMTAAMTIIANGGHGVNPHGIIRIVNRAGEELYRHRPTRHVVLAPGIVAGLHDMLDSVVRQGTGKAAQTDSTLGGKTGTTQNHRDALFIGYGRDLTSGIWLGNDDDTPMQGTIGGGLPARLFADIARVYPH